MSQGTIPVNGENPPVRMSQSDFFAAKSGSMPSTLR